MEILRPPDIRFIEANHLAGFSFIVWVFQFHFVGLMAIDAALDIY